MKILKSVLRVNYNYVSPSIEFGAGLMGPKFINGCKYQDAQNRNTFERIHKLDFQRCFTNNFNVLEQLLFPRFNSSTISPYFDRNLVQKLKKLNV